MDFLENKQAWQLLDFNIDVQPLALCLPSILTLAHNIYPQDINNSQTNVTADKWRSRTAAPSQRWHSDVDGFR